MVSTHGLVTLLIILLHLFYPLKHLDHIRIKLRVMLNIMCGMIHICGNFVVIRMPITSLPPASSAKEKVFDVWGIDFMGPFHVSYGYAYILLVVDYVKAKTTKTNDAKVIVDFVWCAKALINDQGSHFCNKTMPPCLRSMRLCIGWLLLIIPKPMGRLRCLIERSSKFCKRWRILIERIGATTSHYQIVFVKACHLPIEIEHCACWAVKRCNLAFNQAGKERKLQLQELEKLRLKAYCHNPKIVTQGLTHHYL
ncbi:hypothetical protein CR513_17828, partial [Mucuna pruriens]